MSNPASNRFCRFYTDTHYCCLDRGHFGDHHLVERLIPIPPVLDAEAPGETPATCFNCGGKGHRQVPLCEDCFEELNEVESAALPTTVVPKDEAREVDKLQRKIRSLESHIKDLNVLYINSLDHTNFSNDWWHKEWHRATGIPCDESDGYCPLSRRIAASPQSPAPTPRTCVKHSDTLAETIRELDSVQDSLPSKPTTPQPPTPEQEYLGKPVPNLNAKIEALATGKPKVPSAERVEQARKLVISIYDYIGESDDDVEALHRISVASLRLSAKFDAVAASANKRADNYEQHYVLPCFTWAKEYGIDLQTLVFENQGKNCVELLVRELASAREKALEEAAEVAYKMQATAGNVLQKGHNDDAATQYDTAMEIVEAIRALSRAKGEK